MPRQIGYHTHDASQALANVSNYTYTSLRVQITFDKVTTIRLPREHRIRVPSQASRGIRGRQRIGFASAIETVTVVHDRWLHDRVARGLASHLRLKPTHLIH